MTLDRFPYIRTLLKVQLDRLVGTSRVRSIVDVGAYEGAGSAALAARYRGAVVHAIEPAPDSFGRLQKRSKNRNIEPHKLAVCGHDGTSVLHLEVGGGSQSNSLVSDFVRKGAKTSELKVKCQTLATFCKQQNIEDIDLLLLNCEGAEYEIFEHTPSQKVIAAVTVLDLMLHGKSFRFLSEEYAKKKLAINRFLLDSGLAPVYGEPLKDYADLPTGHVRQVWVREKQP